MHAVDDRQFCHAFLFGIEETRVLEGDAHRVGDRRQQTNIRLSERVFHIQILQADDARHLVADDHRHKEQRLRFLAFENWFLSEFNRELAILLIDQPWLAGFDHPLAELVNRHRSVEMDPLTALDEIFVINFAASRVIQRDQRRLCVENLGHLIADEVNDGLELQFGCQPLLNAVDDRQFGVALLRLFEQTLSLVKETGILQRDTHRVGKGLQQTNIRVAESIFFHACQINHATYLVACN
ncbi:MAG: hypothetical protein AKCLJLPJ_02607 [Fimbriimonadales bacterium]|nr:hypothetical protein [Fimbriimonadales bacterium]